MWQLVLNLPMQPSTDNLEGLQSWLAGLPEPAPPEGVSIGLVILQQQALANVQAWGAEPCFWLLQQSRADLS